MAFLGGLSALPSGLECDVAMRSHRLRLPSNRSSLFWFLVGAVATALVPGVLVSHPVSAQASTLPAVVVHLPADTSGLRTLFS